jgi:hypothetical protein
MDARMVMLASQAAASSKANRYSASQEITRILWTREIHYPLLENYEMLTPTIKIMQPRQL